MPLSGLCWYLHTHVHLHTHLATRLYPCLSPPSLTLLYILPQRPITEGNQGLPVLHPPQQSGNREQMPMALFSTRPIHFLLLGPLATCLTPLSVCGLGAWSCHHTEHARKPTEHQNIRVTETSIHHLTRFQSYGPQLCTSLEPHHGLFQPSQRSVLSSPPPPVLKLSESRDLSNHSEDGLTQGNHPLRPQTLRGDTQLLVTIVCVEVDGGLTGGPQLPLSSAWVLHYPTEKMKVSLASLLSLLHLSSSFLLAISHAFW